MRGAGGTPRGFRAHQNNLRRGRRTNEIRRTAPNRQTRQRKAARSNKPIFFSIADAITAGGSPKIIRRANQEVVRHRTHHQNIQNNPTSKNFEPKPNISSTNETRRTRQLNSNAAQQQKPLLRFVPSSKGGTNNKKRENNLQPTSKNFKPIPNTDSRPQNKNKPPEALQFVPSSKGGTNNKKRGGRKMDIGGGVHRIRTLPTFTALDFKGCYKPEYTKDTRRRH